MCGHFDGRERLAPIRDLIQQPVERRRAVHFRVANDRRRQIVRRQRARQRRAEAQRAIDINRLHSRDGIVAGGDVVGLSVLQRRQRRATRLTVERHVELAVDSADGEAERKHRAGCHRRIGEGIVAIILERELDGVAAILLKVHRRAREVMRSNIRGAESAVVERGLVDGVVAVRGVAIVFADVNRVRARGARDRDIARDGAGLVRHAIDINDRVVARLGRVPRRHDVVGAADLKRARAVERHRRIAGAEVGADASGRSLRRAKDVIHHEEITRRFTVADEVLAARGRQRVHLHPILNGVAASADLLESVDHDALRSADPDRVV